MTDQLVPPGLRRPYDAIYGPRGVDPTTPIVTALDEMNGLSNSMTNRAARQKEEETAPGIKSAYDANGYLTVSGMPPEMVQRLMTADRFYQQALESYSQEANRLQTREQGVRDQPLLSALATIAGNLAQNDPTLPGWVRGLGAASRQLNPTADELSQRRLGVLGAQADMANRATVPVVEMARFRSDAINQGLAAARLDLDERRVAAEEGRLEHQVAKEQRERALKFKREAMQLAADQKIDPEALVNLGVQGEYISPEDAEVELANLVGIRDAAGALDDAKERRRFTEDMRKFRLQSDLQERRLAASMTELDRRLTAMDDIADKRLQATLGKQAMTREKLGPVESRDLRGFKSALDAMKSAKEIINSPDAKKYLGGIGGAMLGNRSKWSPLLRQHYFRNPQERDRAEELYTTVNTQILSAMSAVKASFAKTSEKETEMINAVTPQVTHDVGQMNKVLDYWISRANLEVKNLVSANPDVKWSKYLDALPPGYEAIFPADEKPTSNSTTPGALRVPSGWKVEEVK